MMARLPSCLRLACPCTRGELAFLPARRKLTSNNRTASFM